MLALLPCITVKMARRKKLLCIVLNMQQNLNWDKDFYFGFYKEENCKVGTGSAKGQLILNGHFVFSILPKNEKFLPH